MKALHRIIPGILIPALIYTSCEPFETVSDVPEIHFKSYTPYLADTLDLTIQAGELVFSFIDGDADFGLNSRTGTRDTLNFFLNAFQKTDVGYDSIDATIYGRQYGILNDESLVRIGQNKTIKGEINLLIFYLLTPPYDTIKYDFYIVDRAGHKSNVESTTDIGF